MFAEPRGSGIRGLFERARFFEEVTRAGDDTEFFFAAKFAHGLLVQVDDHIVITTDDEKGGAGDASKSAAGQIRTSAARHDCAHSFTEFSRSDERRAAASARSEETESQPGSLDVVFHLFRRVNETVGEELDIETQMTGACITALLLFREQVEKQRAETRFLKCVRNELIAWTVTTAAAAMREKHKTPGVVWNDEFSVEYHVIGRDENFSGAPSHVANIGLATECATEILLPIRRAPDLLLAQSEEALHSDQCVGD
jgi:hypothetical protein